MPIITWRSRTVSIEVVSARSLISLSKKKKLQPLKVFRFEELFQSFSVCLRCWDKRRRWCYFSSWRKLQAVISVHQDACFTEATSSLCFVILTYGWMPIITWRSRTVSIEVVSALSLISLSRKTTTSQSFPLRRTFSIIFCLSAVLGQEKTMVLLFIVTEAASCHLCASRHMFHRSHIQIVFCDFDIRWDANNHMTESYSFHWGSFGTVFDISFQKDYNLWEFSASKNFFNHFLSVCGVGTREDDGATFHRDGSCKLSSLCIKTHVSPKPHPDCVLWFWHTVGCQ